MIDRRAAPRQRTFKTGKITLPHGITDCLIRNMSSNGALLEFLEPPLIPDDFTLLIKPDMTRRQCHVSRRDKLRIGVVFQEENGSPATQPRHTDKNQNDIKGGN